MKMNNDREQNLIEEFEDAVINHEFVAYIQPKYNIFEQRFYGGEVLCRWIHNEEIISPGEFIPVFEKSGQIKRLDRYMFIETLNIIRNWLDHSIVPLPLSVNLSRRSFELDNLAQEMIDCIDEIHIPHSLIQLEITESAYMEREEEVISFVDVMRQNQIEILLDDFGSGYSSLNMLKNVNISILKVDYRLLIQSRIKSRREQILESVVKMGRTIGVPLVVEGVEKEKDVILLKSLGVRYVQGFLYAKPMPLEEYNKIPWTKNSNSHDVEKAPESNEGMGFWEFSATEQLIYENSLSGMAICEYFDGQMFLININRTMRNSAEVNLFELAHSRKNILEYVSEEYQNEVIEYIESVCKRNEKKRYIEFDAKTGIKNIRIRLRISLLTKNDMEYSLLLDIQKIGDNAENVGATTLFEVLDGLDRGYYILDDNHMILYSNPQARKLLPHFVVGAKCTDYKRYDEDCTQCPLDNYNMLISYFSQNLDMFIENYITEIVLDNRKVKLVRIDQSNQEILGSKDAVMRMNQAIARESDVYTEIDIDTEKYTQITFAKRKLFDIPSIGHYTESFYELLENRIDKTTNLDVLEYFSIAGLRREFVDGKRVKARFKYKDMNMWGECIGTFIADGDKRYCCAYTRDVTNDVLRDYDNLTNLFNGAAAKRIINKYIAEHTTDKMALLMFDFDNFKEINDTYGHLFGDKVLVEFAKMVQENLHDNCLAARFGGDEFVVFISKISSVDEVHKIKEEVKNDMEIFSDRLQIGHTASVSIGIAMYPQNGQTFVDLYHYADTKMYEEKKKRK